MNGDEMSLQCPIMDWSHEEEHHLLEDTFGTYPLNVRSLFFGVTFGERGWDIVKIF